MLLPPEDLEEGAVNKNKIGRIIGDIKSTIGIPTQDRGMITTSKSSKKALKYLKEVNGDLEDLDAVLSQKEVKKFIKGLSRDAKRRDSKYDEKNSVIKKIKREVDTLLKQTNPEYKEAMKPVARMTNTLDKMQTSFKLQKDHTDIGFIYDATDTTYSKMDRLGSKPRRSKQLRQSMNALGKESNEDLANKTRASYINQVTKGGTTQGSRKVNLGSSAGGVKGAIAGAFSDVAGRKAAKEGLHATGQLSKNLSNASFVKKLGQFKEPLTRAAEKGSKELAITHCILSQNPEYLKEVMGGDE